MDKNTDPQRRRRTSQGHSFRQCLVQKSKPESQPLETASRNMALLASWTQKCATRLSLHGKRLLPRSVQTTRQLFQQGLHAQKAVSSRSHPAKGNPLAVTKQGVGINSRHLSPAQATVRGSTCSRAPHGVGQDFVGWHRDSPTASVQMCFRTLPSADVDSKETPGTPTSVSMPASVTCTTNLTNRDVYWMNEWPCGYRMNTLLKPWGLHNNPCNK